MARIKGGEYRERHHRNTNNNEISDVIVRMDGRKFEEDYFTTTTSEVVENASHGQYAEEQFPDYGSI